MPIEGEITLAKEGLTASEYPWKDHGINEYTGGGTPKKPFELVGGLSNDIMVNEDTVKRALAFNIHGNAMVFVRGEDKVHFYELSMVPL